jgi:hypothetical protein
MLVFSNVTKWMVIMYVDTATYIRSGKAHKRYLLRESFRENGKIKKKTIASLCKLKQEDIDALKLALKHKKDLQSLQSIKKICNHCKA